MNRQSTPVQSRLTTPTEAAIAGVAFLWFIGVVSDRLEQQQDRFFATVFLGSGLLFLARLFTSVAVAGGIISIYILLVNLRRSDVILTAEDNRL
jgi:4-amino-4-deoxy-L-arabinose transferase-like glycosyltransferase